MNSAELSASALSQLELADGAFRAPELNERQRRNAGRVMQEIVIQRLQTGGTEIVRQRGARYEWGEGIILNRNTRVGDGFWTTMPSAQLNDLRQITADHPAIFLFCFFEVAEENLHVWAIPDDVALRTLATVPENQSGVKTIYISLVNQRLKDASDSPDLRSYYRLIKLAALEKEALASSIKQDAAAKELAVDETDDGEDEDNPSLATDYYSQETVDFLLELPDHVSDGQWHAENKSRYQRVLRDPTRVLVESLRKDFIEALDADVAAGNRNISVLKKNDYGKGGYHDHYWAAFYDAKAKSKTKSCQLFFRMLGKQRIFRYGVAFGNYGEKYTANLHSAIAANRLAVKKYLQSAPKGTIVRPSSADDADGEDARSFAARLDDIDPASDRTIPFPNECINIIRWFPIEELPEHAKNLASEIGEFFRWAWPFFDAARTGQWNQGPIGLKDDDNEEEDEDSSVTIDEDAPRTLVELSEQSALPIEKLQEIEDALLTKQQIILTGPPGTSKTYIAQLFARYFAADRETNSQGVHTTLYMHANWAYEDFFEGIKPFTADGVLKFEPKLGCFLEWIESLRELRPNARHVLVMDEINRCDTAEVLGELLQLLEYRGRAVRLLSGRTFRFPSNVYIIGTMNSADRSIGRMDLALRRRFLWLDLVPDYKILNTWLKRAGNNPVGFSSEALRQCNQLLQDRDIAPEQQVGHALFMIQTFGSETQDPEDKPLIPQALKRIVRFSVLPYVRELCVMQFGRVDTNLVNEVEKVLLACLTEHSPDPAPTDSSVEPEA